jgi:hypothetical protein
MKQTAVEWLQKQLENGIVGNDTSFYDLCEQAKDLEMIQITEAFDDGYENNCDADLYFNKKFKPDYKNES